MIRFSIDRIFGLVTLAGLTGACLTQGAVQAHFHLPVTAHWGNAVLAPGDYKIKVTDDISGRHPVLIEGQGITIHELPAVVDEGGPAGHSSLELVEVRGDYFIKEYKSSLAGKTFSFLVPKERGAKHSKTLEIEN
jgi:hypothetical protein